VIDGRDDDEAWRTTPVITGFRMFDPTEDADPTFRTEARIAYDDANRVGERLRDMRRAAGDNASPALQQAEAEFFTPPVRYSKPGLQAHITYLYGMTTGADQRVGRDARERYAELRRHLDALSAKMGAIR